MVTSTIVLITGIGRGIGKALATAYLSRPNHTVIGAVRNSTNSQSQELKNLPCAAGSRLLLVTIDSSSTTDPQAAIKEIQASGITHLDIVIANAGICPDLMPLDTVDINDVINTFHVNTVAPILLFQAVKPMLEKASSPKWISMSSGAGSITYLEEYGTSYVGAYGVSKAALNWFTVAIHTANKFLTAFAIHPGFVQTDMGNNGARQVGMEQAPTTLEESTSKTTDFIDKSSRESTSGQFYDVTTGLKIPW